MQARAHGAYRRTDQARNVLNGEIAIEAKDDGDAVVRAEAAEGALQRIALVDLAMGVMWGTRLRCSSQVVVTSMAASAERVSAGVDEDAAEPGLESLRIAEPVVISPCSDERVVGRIFSLLGVSQDEAGEPIRLVEASFEQPLEGLPPRSLDVDRDDLSLVGQLRLRSGICPFPVPTRQGSETFILRGSSAAEQARCCPTPIDSNQLAGNGASRHG